MDFEAKFDNIKPKMKSQNNPSFVIGSEARNLLNPQIAKTLTGYKLTHKG